jgi:beta-lactamase regulating signal transducer with metallopeptidase domain
MTADLLIELGWKSALACSVALLASLALRGRPAAQRVAVLRAGVVALLLLPLLVLTVPVLEIAILPAASLPALPIAADALASPGIAAAPTALGIDWVALAYTAGVGLVLLHLAIGLFLLRRWTRHAVPASHPVWVEAFARAAEPLRRPVRLLVSPSIASPLSLGIAPATILIGPNIERRPDRAAAVIAHEIAHVRRFDWLAMLVGRFALALFWFNPLAWLLVIELTRHTELAADEEAVTHVARAEYAQTLLAVAGGCGTHAACGMAVTRSAMARRIRRVLDAAPRRPASRLVYAALVAGIPLGITPLAAMQIVERPHAATTPRAEQAAGRPEPVTSAVRSREVREAPVRKPMARAPRVPSSRRDKPVRITSMAEAAPRPVTGRGVPPAGRGAAPPTEQRLAAVQRLRSAALEYRDRARNLGLSLDIRQGYRNAAASLADEADKLEKQAKQIAGIY